MGLKTSVYGTLVVEILVLLVFQLLIMLVIRLIEKALQDRVNFWEIHWFLSILKRKIKLLYLQLKLNI